MVETLKPQKGTWTLIAPNGRKWEADNPIAVVSKEQRERVPEHIAVQRILDAINTHDPEICGWDGMGICPVCGEEVGRIL